MTTVIIGANGQLGRALRQQFPDAVALDRAALDVTDAAAVRDYRWASVDVVLNAAAWTAVDAAEDPANHAAVRAVNVDAVGHLAGALRTSGATLVHVSSEYVFNYGVYGARKAHAELHRQGRQWPAAPSSGLMRRQGLRGISRAKGPRTTVPGTGPDTRSDLVNRAFTATGPGQLWVAPTSPTAGPSLAGSTPPSSSTCSPAGRSP